MNKKERAEYEHLLDVVEERILSGKKRFGDMGLRKFYQDKLAEK